MPSYVTLVLMLLMLGGVISAITIVSMAFMLARPARLTDGKAIWALQRLSPGDLGLRFEEVCFDIRDEQTGQLLRIAGWWMPHPLAAGRCVVLVHGYADAKVGAISWAPLWHSMEFNILAIDLRAHGESGGKYFTAGSWERHDLVQVINQLRITRPASTTHLVLFGVSAGAAVVAATAAISLDLSAIVLERPPADFRVTAASYFNGLGAPGGFFVRLAIIVAQRLTQSDLSALRTAHLIKQINCPIMLIIPDLDPMVTSADRLELDKAMQGRKHPERDVYWQPNTSGQITPHIQPQEYEERLRAFTKSA